MLARVTGGKSGIAEYLKDGIKSGRELSRDEIDHRVVIDGNLAITDELIKGMELTGRSQNYLHITLSFGERDISTEKIQGAYSDYKNSLMAAYDKDEYNIYAEIHYPKTKSYQDKKTGETIERFPHVHIVIPQKNLVTDKALNPFGKYSNNIKYHDAIQETVNRKHDLESPYDNQRKYRIGDKSDFISRYKGDSFTGNNREFKVSLFDDINKKNIKTMDSFIKELAKYGEVSTGKKGAIDEYLQVKPFGKTKNIRLKENAFKPLYIESRELLREKPSDQVVQKNLSTWINKTAHEMKHIHVASPKKRNEYNSLNNENKEDFLNDRRNEYDRIHGIGTARTNHIREGGRKTNRKLGIERNGGQHFTNTANGLSGLPERGLVRREEIKFKRTEGILPSNEHNNLEPRGAGQHNQLRRTVNRGGRRRGIIPPDKPQSLTEQFLLNNTHRNSKKVLRKFNDIKKNLDPKMVLDHFAKTNGVIKSHYEITKAKDGTPRIKVGGNAYNISDFSTKHMHKSWEDTQEILTTLYKEQLKKESKNIDKSVRGLSNFSSLKTGLPNSKKPKLPLKNRQVKISSKARYLLSSRGTTKEYGLPKRNNLPRNIQSSKAENYALNSIIFVSNKINQQKKPSSNLEKIQQSVQILKHLQRKEIYGDNKMEQSNTDKNEYSDNTISSANINLENVHDIFKKQRDLVKLFQTKMTDLVPAKDLQNGVVEFNDKSTGDPVFKDVGTHVVMSSKEPTIDHVAIALTFAAEKFGKVKINGTDEFKKQVVDVAVAKDLSIVFDDKKMQEQFVKGREELQTSPINKDLYSNDNTITSGDPITQNKSAAFSREPDAQNNSAAFSREPDAQNNSAAFSKPFEPQVPVTLVNHGAAPYKHIEENTGSYFVETSDGKTQWGVGLKEAIKDSKANIGDEISIKKLGSEDVTVKVDIKDENDKVIGQQPKEVLRVNWEIKSLTENKEIPQVKVDNFESGLSDKAKEISNIPDIKEQPLLNEKTESFRVTYNWSNDDNAMQIKVNGRPPKEVPVDIMTNIKNNDKFLDAFSIEEIQKGGLDISKSNAQPVAKTFNASGAPMQDTQAIKTSLKQ